MRPPPLLLLVLLASLAPPGGGAEACEPEGTCGRLRASYYAVIQGAPCARLFAAGACEAECLRSLGAVLGRRAWAGCAARCGWDPEFEAAARGWWGLCRRWARPDPPAAPPPPPPAEPPPPAQPRRWPRAAAAALVAVAALAVLAGGARARRRAGAWVRRRLRGRAGRVNLDLDPDKLGLTRSTRLDMLKRGARRHLKALRMTQSGSKLY